MRCGRMTREFDHKLSPLFFAALLQFNIGCQPNPNTVTGTVLLDGKVVTTGSNSRGTVVFEPASGEGTIATGLLDSGGRFKLATGALPEVMPGKYQVSVSVVELLPATEQSERSVRPISPSKYASTANSGLQATVAPGANDFTFDLASEPAEETTSLPEGTATAHESEVIEARESSAE